ncbi:MAG: phosphoribosylaminoimidazolesuccinocarboxamide synthase [Ignavibacteria bacterium]
MGSVKDLKILKEATNKEHGIGRFIYSNRYSVFDWGEMPDQIPNKGAAISILGAYFFEKLESMNIPTHYLGLVENDEVKKLSELNNPTNIMQMKLLRVIKPELLGNKYDYSKYKNSEGGFLIPLEVIYRNFLPPGSSIFKRLKNGEITPKDIGLDNMPEPNQKLDKPIYDVSTKLEITDRYMSWNEAQEISGLSNNELCDLKELTKTVNNLISNEFSKIGLVNEDGKIEVGFDLNRNLMVVDVFGTLDECRFTYEGLPVSKEITRIYYRNTPWNSAVEDAKKKDRQHWKEICELQPEMLTPKLKTLISQVYSACTNEITGKEWFKDTPHLKDILKEIKIELKL